jgi:hypothetical protein
VSKYVFAIDRDGAPVLLDAAAAAPADPEADPNPAAEAAKKVAQGSAARRRDAIVDAARTLEDLSPAGVEQLVRRRWRGDRSITPEDIQSFSADARAQRVHDVADALDFRIRRSVYGRSGSKQPHVQIPRGIVGKSLAALDPEEKAAVIARLRIRGWSDAQIKRFGIRRVDKDGAMSSVIEGKS